MNIIDFVPGVLLGMFISLNAGLILRFLSEGASFKTACKSVFRFYFIPLALLVFVMTIYNNKRRILFNMKKSSDVEDELINRLEPIIQTKWKIFCFFVIMSFSHFRLLLDGFIKVSIEYEKEQVAKPLPQQKKQKKFFEYYLDDIDLEKHIFS
jgi:hypothetical protein